MQDVFLADTTSNARSGDVCEVHSLFVGELANDRCDVSTGCPVTTGLARRCWYCGRRRSRCRSCDGSSGCRSNGRRGRGNLNDGCRRGGGDRFSDRLGHRFWRGSRGGHWLSCNWSGTSTGTIANNDEHSANGNGLVFLNEDLLDHTGNGRWNLSVNLVC